MRGFSLTRWLLLSTVAICPVPLLAGGPESVEVEQAQCRFVVGYDIPYYAPRQHEQDYGNHSDCIGRQLFDQSGPGPGCRMYRREPGFPRRHDGERYTDLDAYDMPVNSLKRRSQQAAAGSLRGADSTRGILPFWSDKRINEVIGRCGHESPTVGAGPRGHRVAVWHDTRNGYNDVFFQRYDHFGEPSGTNTAMNVGGHSPAVAVHSSGSFVVVWTSVHIYGQLFDADGNAIGEPFQITDVQDYCFEPSVGADAAGNFVVAWMDLRNGNSDIYCQRYDPAGMPIGINFRVNDDGGPANQYLPAVGMKEAATFVVTWQDYRSGNADVYCQWYDGEGTPMGANFRVNDDGGSDNQYCPSVALGGAGNFVVAWDDSRNGDLDVYCQRYDADGTSVDGNFVVNDEGSGTDQYHPVTTMDDVGDIMLVWADHRDGPADIYAQRYEGSGSPYGDNFLVNDDVGSAGQYFPSAGMDGMGNFSVVWSDERNGDFDIYGQRFNAMGMPIGGNSRVNDDVGGTDQYYPSVAMSNGGEFIVAWDDFRSESDFDIYAQRFNATGTALGSNFKVNDDVGSMDQYYPSVARGSDGRFAAAWEDYRNGDSDIYAQRFDTAGTPAGDNFRVNDDASNADQYCPSVAMSSAGDFVVTWYDSRDGNFDIYIQRYDVTGVPLGGNLRVNDDLGSANQYEPSVALDDGGAFMVAWEDRRSGTNIYAQQYDATGMALGSNFRVNDDEPGAAQFYPDVATDGASNYVVVWQDHRDGSDIYAQRYSTDGIADGANWPANIETDGSERSPSVTCHNNRVAVVWYDNRILGQGWDIWCSGWQFHCWGLTASIVDMYLVLQWAPVPGAEQIRVYRSPTAFFEPDVASGSNLVASLPGDADDYSDAFGVGDPDVQAFYRLVAWDETLGELTRTWTVGEFDFAVQQ